MTAQDMRDSCLRGVEVGIVENRHAGKDGQVDRHPRDLRRSDEAGMDPKLVGAAAFGAPDMNASGKAECTDTAGLSSCQHAGQKSDNSQSVAVAEFAAGREVPRQSYSTRR